MMPTPAPTRRSSRVKELPKVNYDDEDWEVEHFGKRRRLGAKNYQVDKVVEETKRKSPRALVSIDYGMMDANMDEEIFCHGCKQWVVPPCAGCGDCSMQFVHPDKLKLEVVRSKVGGAGQGLMNNGATIVTGTLVGPYTGNFVSLDDYKKEEKKGRESGYAWLLYDSETMDKPCGYIDPGSAPDPALNKLAKANHPSKKYEQCFVGYGPEYAAELGIDPSTFDTYTRPENHKTVAIPCPSCDTPFSAQHFLDTHLQSCRKKQPSTLRVVGNKKGPVGGKVPCINP